jgi:hypothetical protein
MFITTHALIGALIAEQMPNHPVLAFVLAIAAHFLADAIPHGDSKLYRGYASHERVRRAVAYVMIDCLVAMFFVLGLFNSKFIDHRFAISCGVVGGVLPDFLVGLFEIFRLRQLRWIHRVHFYFHNLVVSKRGDVALKTGIAIQFSLLALVLSRIG